MGMYLTVYVEQLKKGKYRGVRVLPDANEPKDHCSCRTRGICWYHKYCWYNCNNSDVCAVLTGLKNNISVDQVVCAERPKQYSPEFQPRTDKGEFPFTVVRLSDILSYDFNQLVSRGDEPKEPLSERCSVLLTMLKQIQQAVGETPPEEVRLLCCVD